MSSVPSPFIYWGQSSRTVFLRIALKDVKEKPDVSLSNDRISFEGRGHGAHGDSLYKFEIVPFRYIAPEKSKLRITGSEVIIDACKRDPTTTENPWPRLTQSNAKCAWIKPDFDWMDVSEDEDVELINRKKMEKAYLDKLTKDLEATKDEAMQDLKKHYLFSYSLFQFITWTFILVKVILGLIYTGAEDYKVYDDVGIVLVISQIFSVLEIIHPLIGLVKSGVIAPLAQVCGRCLMLLAVICNEPKLQTGPATTYLILFWSLADFIRHPFYMMSSMKASFYWLVWLRYTMWIPLYPLGVLCEYLILWQAIPLFTQSGKLSISLPNPYNFSFSITSIMYMHLVVLPLGLLKLMAHMYSLRKKKLRKPSKSGQDAASYTDAKKTN
ncbi:very-long-chain (3R)-3-hydroxyacyl-CoA dehydratase-like [Watersipora subatra]|uniref:very-long-chain (3R)-3-hydroxyacyl-CoA dehydratase-like n=1 Tax=Watersipora subatra TaxID=2589382 RepID=UPI00355BC457